MAVSARALLVLVLSGCQGEPANLGGAGNWTCDDHCFLDFASPANAGALFFGPEDAAPESKPSIVYPLDGSVHPPNLPEITVQWRRPRLEQTLFRLRIAGAATRFEAYTPCFAVADGCRFSLPETRWLEISRALRGREATLVVSGTDPEGRAVAHSEPVRLRFTPEDLTSGLYYWSTRFQGNDDRGTIFRLVFGERRAQPFIEPESATNPYGCGGCHAVSRNGTKIAWSARHVTEADAGLDQRAGHLAVRQVTVPTNPLIGPGAAYDSSMMALSPDGSRVLVAYDNRLELRDAEGDTPGRVLASVTPEQLAPAGHGYFPEFSPDGSEVALTLSDDPDSPHAVRNGTIAVLPYDRTNDRFGTAEEIVAASGDGLYHFYPTWSPDGNWIAFVSAPLGAGDHGSYDQVLSRLRLVSRHDGRVFELGRASQGEGLASTLPKFAPIQHGNLFFLTYNSKMDYGLLLRNSQVSVPEYRYPQLWLSVIDMSLVTEDTSGGSLDPSAAPLWLPFQDLTQRNHLGYWADKLACDPDLDGGAEGNSCGPGYHCDAQLGQCIATVK